MRARVLPPAQLPVEERLVAEIPHPRGQLPALGQEAAPARWPPRGAVVAPATSGVVLPALIPPSTVIVALLPPHAHPGELGPLAVAPLKVVELDRRFRQGEAWREDDASAKGRDGLRPLKASYASLGLPFRSSRPDGAPTCRCTSADTAVVAPRVVDDPAGAAWPQLRQQPERSARCAWPPAGRR